METIELINETRKTNKTCLCELLANNMHLVIKLCELEDKEEKENLKKLIVNSLAIIKWNIQTM